MSAGRPLRILLVAEALGTSGVTSYCRNLMRALSRRHKLMLVSPGGDHADRLGRFAERTLVLHWLERRWLSLFIRGRLLAEAGAFHPDLVHALSGHAARPARVLSQGLGLPVVVTAHHYVERAGGLRLHPRVRRILAVSQALRENLVNTGRIPRELVSVVPNGIDLSEYGSRPEPATARAEAAASGLAPRIPVVGFFGRLTVRKGPEYLVRAAAILEKDGVEAEYLFAGDGPERRRIEKLAGQLGVRKRITFREGYVDGRDLLPALDVFVAPSLQEALGIGILEAMACGVPVVASAVGGVFAVIRDGENGLLAPPRDGEALAGRIRELLLNPGRRLEMARAGRETVERSFSLPVMVGGTEEAYYAALDAGDSQAIGK
ncbi:MAG TPA: glycosyltransferase family 4 protein [Planctomycetota bacterium]|nr:glycosyltransferase family 4 protein [Planctomycetota bacterium]